MPSMHDDLCSTSTHKEWPERKTWFSRNVSPCSDMGQNSQSNQMLGTTGKDMKS